MALRIPYPQILNELSFGACASHEDFLEKMVQLKGVMDAMRRIGFSYLIGKSNSIYEKTCYPGVKFRNWLAGKVCFTPEEKTLRDFIMGAITKTPAFEETPEYFVGNCEYDLFFGGVQIYNPASYGIPAFLVSYCNALPSIALASGVFSEGDSFIVTKHELNEDCMVREKPEPVSVCTTPNSVEAFRDTLQARIVEGVRSGRTILDVCKELWPYMSFSDEVERALPTMDVGNGLIVNCLLKLHSAFVKCLDSGCRDFRNACETTKSLAMDESDSTRRAYPDSRTFHWQGRRRDCWPHFRINRKFRIHFIPDFEDLKLYIGYIGPHLPT